jgi:hypothetical protein
MRPLTPAFLIVLLAATAGHAQDAKLTANGTRHDAKKGTDVTLADLRVGIGPALLDTMEFPVAKGNMKGVTFDLYELDTDDKIVGARGRATVSADGKTLVIDRIGLKFDTTVTVRLVARELTDGLMVGPAATTGKK